MISTVLSLALSILMGEYFRIGAFASLMRTAVELLAGIPSIVYGFIGLFFLVPVIRVIQLALGVPPFGVGILTASILLAFMVLPYSASIGREVINLVPTDLKEAAFSLGATPSETIWRVSIPYARSGILGGVFLSSGSGTWGDNGHHHGNRKLEYHYGQYSFARQHNGERHRKRVYGGYGQCLPRKPH